MVFSKGARKRMIKLRSAIEKKRKLGKKRFGRPFSWGESKRLHGLSPEAQGINDAISLYQSTAGSNNHLRSESVFGGVDSRSRGTLPQLLFQNNYDLQLRSDTLRSIRDEV